MSDLEREISDARIEISADSISMSISELTNLYREGVLEIRPEFQRLYRWSQEQKSRLVESVLLGIPLPSLFVSQAETGKWELVDGLQRVSTLLELQGVLRATGGIKLPALTLSGTKFLPHLDGMSWTGADGNRLTEAQKLDIRLARLDLRVIKRSSDPKTKFDLFQRLNSFGSTLEPQEIRSAMIAGTNSEALAWLNRLAANEFFVDCLGLTERLTDEQFDVELVLRFLMLHDRSLDGMRAALADFSTKLDDWAVDLAANYPEGSDQLEDVFVETFTSLAANGGDRIFRKWDAARGRFRGSFLNTSFEVIALGVGYHIANGLPHRTDYLDAARELWLLPNMNTRFATGLATQDRFAKTIPIGRKLMADPPVQITAADLP
ncbi:DUF262 domain-containing protein [Nocardioides panacisoli]|uniref:GmrSD restriction endonucleases N-terminal domain-containing protein n=1 Tax=Nocardioides panacisoli TaxID=627624 RepID=A0ABP7HTN0_9ACTN